MTTRRRPYERSPHGSIVISSKDIEILQALLRYRFLHTDHICGLTGRGAGVVRNRLSRLFHTGYVDRPAAQRERNVWRGGSPPLVYALGELGASVLEENGALSPSGFNWRWKNQKVKRPYLMHTLATAEVLVGLDETARARKELEYELLDGFTDGGLPPQWSLQVTGYGERKRTVTIVPDAVFSLGSSKANSKGLYFLEVDRGTMPIVASNPERSSIRKKLVAYHESWKQKKHVDVFGVAGTRVLFITTSGTRVESMRDAARAVLEEQAAPRKRGQHMLFSTIKEVKEVGVIAANWRKAGGDETVRVLED